MKIWRNNKRVIKSSPYIHCEDCALCGEDFGHCYECLALLYKISDSKNICSCGYKYETNV